MTAMSGLSESDGFELIYLCFIKKTISRAMRLTAKINTIVRVNAVCICIGARACVAKTQLENRRRERERKRMKRQA